MRMKEDMVMMKDGKMKLRRNGKLIPMKEDMGILDGTRIMMDGTVMMADGIARTMMEGEALTMDGRIIEMEDREIKDEPSQ